MDENEFFRGLEGTPQQGQDLVTGAEHLVRLKKQVGFESGRDADLELEKEATFGSMMRKATIAGGMIATKEVPEVLKMENSRAPLVAMGGARLRAAAPTPGGSPLSVKLAGPKLDALKATLAKARNGAKAGLMWQGAGLKGALHNVKNPAGRAHGVGQIAGMAVPAVAAGVVGYGAGRVHQHLKNNVEDEQEKLASTNNILSSKLAAMQKTAGILDGLKGMNPGTKALIAGGAAIGAGGTYLASRPQENGKSKAEQELEEAVGNQKEGPDTGLLKKMHHRNTELAHGHAKAFREHPVKAGLFGAATGASVGYGLAQMIGGAAKMRGQ